MAITISFAVQKGGAAKTTSAGITAYMLSEMGYKVLGVDMDSQGNFTELMFRGKIKDIYDFYGQTVLEAIKEMDARKYIHSVSENLDMLTAEDLLATLPKYLWTEVRGNAMFTLKATLATVADRYDFIIIDTPPAIGDQTLNSLCASDYVVIMFETSPFCYSALPRFFESVEVVQKYADLKVAGILRTMLDGRRNDSRDFADLVDLHYGQYTFDTVLKRIASTGRLALHGFYSKSSRETKEGTEQYEPFIKELLERVGAKQPTVK